MTAKQLSDYIFISKYARWDSEEGRRETFDEATTRMFDMHRTKYADVKGIEDHIAYAESAFRDGLVLGSQRALQFAGEPIFRKEARIYNCWMSFCDRERFFQEAFWLLLCGGGTGFSMQKHHIAKLPNIAKPKGNGSTRTHVIPDTIEGWADSLGVLLDSYFHPGQGRVIFDYGLIRPEGAPLSSGTGKAPGPDPLRKALDLVRTVLDRCIDNGQDRLRTIDAYDVAMHASDAVLSGGVRRSASICIFSSDDELMARAKTGAFMEHNPQRKCSNNSALLVRGKTTREEFANLISFTRQWGEPGFYWADDTEFIPNPCVEIGSRPIHPVTMVSGWQACNLSTINAEACKSLGDFGRACRAAAILGTLQAGYTSFDYLGDVSEEITRHEALLGVSMTGMMRNPDLVFNEDTLRGGARVVLETNSVIAGILGINEAARACCLKPEGTGSCVLQTSPGMHADHDHRFIRRATANPTEEPFKHFAKINPHAIEDSTWSKGNKIVSFALEAPNGAIVKKDLTALEMLDKVRLVKRAWVDAGKRPGHSVDERLSHNVSNTIDVRSEEWGDVEKYIFDHQNDFAGVSFINDCGDLDFSQAPFVSVLTAEELVSKYGQGVMFASGLIVDGIHAYGDLWVACDTSMDRPLGIGIDLEVMDMDANKRALRVDWVRRFRQFAVRYFDRNWVTTSHCLKSVHNTKMWTDLRRDTIDVDYKTMDETDGSNIAISQTVACAGGSCAINI